VGSTRNGNLPPLDEYSDRILAFDILRRIRVSRVRDQRRIDIPQFRKSINPLEIVFLPLLPGLPRD
jgi:hypothetical protein